jgi:hypothetical protein
VQLTRKLTDGSPKRASYWQSVLQAGLPIFFFYRLTDYLVSRATTGVGFRHPLWSEVMADAVVVIAVSALNWWKAKNRRA